MLGTDEPTYRRSAMLRRAAQYFRIVLLCSSRTWMEASMDRILRPVCPVRDATEIHRASGRTTSAGNTRGQDVRLHGAQHAHGPRPPFPGARSIATLRQVHGLRSNTMETWRGCKYPSPLAPQMQPLRAPPVRHSDLDWQVRESGQYNA